MNTSSIAEAETRRNRRLLFLGIGLILFAVGFTAVRLLLPLLAKTLLANTNLHQPKEYQSHYGVQVYDAKSQQASQASRATALRRISELRDKWRVWAGAHRALMAQMKATAPNDTKVFDRIFNALPMIPPPEWIDNHGAISDLHTVHLTWQPLQRFAFSRDNIAHTKNATEKQHLQQGAMTTTVQQHKDFATYRDIILSQTLMPGLSTLRLWVSGRITEDTMQRQYAPSKSAWGNGKPKEILPAFGFITTKKG